MAPNGGFSEKRSLQVDDVLSSTPQLPFFPCAKSQVSKKQWLVVLVGFPSRPAAHFMANWLVLWSLTFWETVDFPLDPQVVMLFAERSTAKTTSVFLSFPGAEERQTCHARLRWRHHPGFRAGSGSGQMFQEGLANHRHLEAPSFLFCLGQPRGFLFVGLLI